MSCTGQHRRHLPEETRTGGITGGRQWGVVGRVERRTGHDQRRSRLPLAITEVRHCGILQQSGEDHHEARHQVNVDALQVGNLQKHVYSQLMQLYNKTRLHFISFTTRKIYRDKRMNKSTIKTMNKKWKERQNTTKHCQAIAPTVNNPRDRPAAPHRLFAPTPFVITIAQELHKCQMSLTSIPSPRLNLSSTN